MLNRNQITLLTEGDLCMKIAEECSEVIKAVLKHGAHGARPEFQGVRYDNVHDVNEEFSQVEDLMDEYQRRFGS